MAEKEKNSVIWTQGARPPKAKTRRQSLSGVPSRLFLVITLGAIGAGAFGLPFLLNERSEAEIIIIAGTPTAALRKEVESLKTELEKFPGVRSVRLIPDTWTSDESPLAESELDRLLKEPCSHPHLALFVNPVTAECDPSAWGRRAVLCRAAGISVGAIVTPPESRPGAWAALPTRQMSLGDGRAGTFSVLLRGLDQLEEGGALSGVTLSIKLHGQNASFNRDSLERAFKKAFLPTAGATAKPNVVELDLGKIDLVKLRPPTGAGSGKPQQLNLMVYPIGAKDLIAEPAEGIEVVLRKGNRVISRSYSPIDRVPPESLYVPLAALLKTDRTKQFTPTLPQQPDDPHVHNRDRLPWNLLWMKEASPGGITVYWPDHRKTLPVGKPFGDLGKTIPTLPQKKEHLQRYQAVILDASVPEGIDTDFRLKAEGDGKQYHLDEAVYVPGFFRHQKSCPIPKEEINEFLTALKEYWEQGGTVVLVGSNPMCFDKSLKVPGIDAKDLITFQRLLERLDEGHGLGLADFLPGPPPRRVIIAYDDTESAAKQIFPTLPPLTDDGQAIPPGVEFARQSEAFLGAPREIHPKGGWQLPGRSSLTRRIAARLGLESEAVSGSDIEFATLLREVLPDSEEDFAFQCVARVRTRFNHPGLHVELQGRPAFRRGYPATAVERKVLSPELFQIPFYKEGLGYVPYCDLYHTVFRRLDSATPVAGLHDTPWLEANRPLVDGLNLPRFSQYLRDQLFGPRSLGQAPEVVVAFLNRESAARDRPDDAGEIGWPLLQIPTKAGEVPFPREPKKLTPVPARPGHHLIFVGKNDPSEGDWKKTLNTYFTGHDALKMEDWWGLPLSSADSDPYGRRLLFMGRGRFHRLLETALSRDMQAVECRTQPELPNELKTTFHVDHPEAVDLLRRIVHERLRVSFTPAWVPKIGPGSAWKPLVWAGKGSGQVPLICAANGPKTTPGNSPGRILLFLLDPQYESVMHRLRDAELSGWTDYGATTTFDKNGFPESASVGVRLRVGSPGAELPTYCLHLSVHPVLDEGPVFLMEEAERTTPLSAKMEVIVRPSLGLSQRNEIRLVQASAFGQEAREVATKLSGKSVIELVKPHSTTSASESVELKPGGTVFVISKATLDQLMKDFGAPTSPFPQHLPPLIECKLVVEGSKPFATSVFAPVPPRFLRAQGQELYFGGSLDFAPPAVQVIDGLLEFLGKKKTMELETQADGLSFRLLSKAAGNSVPTASEIVVSVAETGAVVPPSDYSVDLSLPAQAIVRLRATATKWAGQRLKVTIRKTSGHEEEHYAFLPGSPHETPEAPRRVSLTPSELGIVAPRPEEFILDTLAAITMPETLRADLDSTGDTSRREFQAPHRGILGLPMTTSQAPSVASFTKDFVRIRTEARHSRGWYLMAMVAFSLWVLLRRLKRSDL